MTVLQRNWKVVLLRALSPFVILLTAAALLLRFPPDAYGFYPQCPVFHYLHLQCPGCGTTRALSALLHGHIAEAFRLNALTITLLPAASAYAAICYRRALQPRPFRWPQPPALTIYVTLTIATLFTLTRNLTH